MADDELEHVLFEDSDEDSKTANGGAVAAPLATDVSGDDFYRQLHNTFTYARTTPEPQTNSSQAAASLQQPVASPPASKAMLILDPADVLAQQQKAAANRSPPIVNHATATAQNAAIVSQGAPQHLAQVPGPGNNMMYRPVASAAPISGQPGPSKPSLLNNRAQFMHHIQQLLAFADIRWKETNQTPKRQAARKLVQDVKQDPTKTQQFQQGILRLVGDELVSEFHLTRADRPDSARSQGAAAAGARQQQVRPQLVQHPGQHQQLPGISTQPIPLQHMPPVAGRQHMQQQPAHMPGMSRPTGPTLVGAATHPMPHGHIKQEGGGLQPGPVQMQRAPSPQLRSVSPAPGGLTHAQLTHQQQHAAMQQAAMQQAQGAAGSRPASAKRPAPTPAAAPAPKRQATKQEDEDVMDLLQNAGVNEEDEREALFGRSTPTSSRGPAPPPPRILNPHPLQQKVQEALRQYNIQGVHPGLQAYLNQAVWLHMEGLLSQACKMASQRGDLSRKQEGMQMTTDIRKALGEKARIERDKATAKEEAARKALLEAPKTKDKDGDEATQKKVKEAQKEELDRQNRAQTNQALGAALGGGARWQKFHARVKPAGAGAKPTTTEGSVSTSAAAAAKPATSSLAEKAAARPQQGANTAHAASVLPGASRSLLPPSRLMQDGQIVGLKDLVAVLEHHPIYCKSDQLYQLYDRLDSS